jgi:hypothetical protein
VYRFFDHVGYLDEWLKKLRGRRRRHSQYCRHQ